MSNLVIYKNKEGKEFRKTVYNSNLQEELNAIFNNDFKLMLVRAN